MTHDELLAKVDAKITTCQLCLADEVGCYHERNQPWKALRAVVELHKPEPRLDETLIRKEVIVCGHCWCNKDTWTQAYRYNYPCPTITEIMDNIK